MFHVSSVLNTCLAEPLAATSCISRFQCLQQPPLCDIIIYLDADGFLPGGSGTTIRHNTQITCVRGRPSRPLHRDLSGLVCFTYNVTRNTNNTPRSDKTPATSSPDVDTHISAGLKSENASCVDCVPCNLEILSHQSTTRSTYRILWRCSQSFVALIARTEAGVVCPLPGTLVLAVHGKNTTDCHTEHVILRSEKSLLQKVSGSSRATCATSQRGVHIKQLVATPKRR
jgi:hypothetical protein